MPRHDTEEMIDSSRGESIGGAGDSPSRSQSNQQNNMLTTATGPNPPIGHAHYMGLSGPALRTAIGLTAGLSFLAFGYGQGDVGGVMLMDNWRETFPRIDAYGDMANSIYTSTTISSWNLGCLVGAVFTFFLCNLLGRKGCIIVGLAVEIIGKIIQSSSFSLGQYIAGRVISGVGNGFIASTIPAWQAETLKTHRRGTLLIVSFGACITLGIAIAYWLSYAFHFLTENSASWRFPTAFSIVFLLPALVIMCFMPESPRYLLLTAREKEAYNVLSALHELPHHHEEIRREVLMVKQTVLRLASGSSISSLWTMGKERHLHRVILAIGLSVMQQFTGINLFIQFLGSMFAAQLAFPVPEALILAACCATWFFLTSLAAVVGIDRYWGRRTLTMFGSAGMCTCLIVLAIASSINTRTAMDAMTAFLFLYVSFFSIGWQGMSWLWSVELIPLSIRGPANALATSINWLCNFVVVITCPVLFTRQEYRTYIVYAVFNFAWLPIIYFFYPETGSRSLEEVDLVFDGANKEGNAWFSVVSVAKKEPKWYDVDGEKTSHSGQGSTYPSDPSDPSSTAGLFQEKRVRGGGPLGSSESE